MTNELRNTELSPRQMRWLMAHGINPYRIARMLARFQKTYAAEYILKANRFQLVKLADQAAKGRGFGMRGNLFGPVEGRKERVYVRPDVR